MKKNFSIFILVFIIAGVGFSIYEEATKKPTAVKSKRIPCQAKTTTFERIYKKEKILEAQELLKSGNSTFESDIWKAKYAQSKIFDFISKEQIDTIHQNVANSHIQTVNNGSKKLHIKFYTRENDPEDPNKKSDNCKLYAGYLVYEFFLDKQMIYKIQSDFLDFKGKDIPNRIECIFNSFLTVK